MSKARKKRDNQVYIKDIEEWKSAVAKPMLLVAEIYAPHFGPCEIMFPFIDELMTNLDNQGLADEVHWAIVNVSKLEDEKAAVNAEDALKKQETKVGGEKPKEEGDTTSGAVDDSTGAGTATNKDLQEPNSEGEMTGQEVDMTIPYLQKYAGFNHPTPHYLFFRNGVIIDELRGANPPKLEQLVRKWISIKDVPSPDVIPPKATEAVAALEPVAESVPAALSRHGSITQQPAPVSRQGSTVQQPAPVSRQGSTVQQQTGGSRKGSITQPAAVSRQGSIVKQQPETSRKNSITQPAPVSRHGSLPPAAVSRQGSITQQAAANTSRRGSGSQYTSSRRASGTANAHMAASEGAPASSAGPADGSAPADNAPATSISGASAGLPNADSTAPSIESKLKDNAVGTLLPGTAHDAAPIKEETPASPI